MVHEKAPTTKENLLTAVWERWNHFDEEYCFRVGKSLPEITETIIKVREGELSINSNFFVNELHHFSPNIRLFHNIFLCMAWEENTIRLIIWSRLFKEYFMKQKWSIIKWNIVCFLSIISLFTAK